MNEDPTPGTENQLEQFEQLALSLLIYPADPRVRKPRLFLGRIPAQFPLDVPVPAQSRVLGTLARSEENIEITLESDLTAEETVAFYRAQLKERGWNELEDDVRMHHRGFVPFSQGPHNHTVFCQGPDGPSLTLNITRFEGNASTSVRLHVDLGREQNPCTQRRQMRRHMHSGPYQLIPSLYPPAGSWQQPGGGSGGNREALASATLISDLDIPALARHYQQQLIQAGWVQGDEGINGPIAWHTWKFTDEDQEPWHGLFFLFTLPEKQNEHYLSIKIMQKLDDTRKSGFNWLRIS